MDRRLLSLDRGKRQPKQPKRQAVGVDPFVVDPFVVLAGTAAGASSTLVAGRQLPVAVVVADAAFVITASPSWLVAFCLA